MRSTEYLDWAAIRRRMKELRNKNRMSRERLSEIVGVSPSFINLVERGVSGMSIDNLYRVSRALGVSVDYLLTGEQEGVIKMAPAKQSRLNALLGDCSDNEFEFAVGLITYIKDHIDRKR